MYLADQNLRRFAHNYVKIKGFITYFQDFFVFTNVVCCQKFFVEQFFVDWANICKTLTLTISFEEDDDNDGDDEYSGWCSCEMVNRRKSLDRYFQLGYYQRFPQSQSQMLFKIGVFKNFAIFTGKHLRWSLFSIKLQAWNF